jgi:hypothetical protein
MKMFKKKSMKSNLCQDLLENWVHLKNQGLNEKEAKQVYKVSKEFRVKECLQERLV